MLKEFHVVIKEAASRSDKGCPDHHLFARRSEGKGLQGFFEVFDPGNGISNIESRRCFQTRRGEVHVDRLLNQVRDEYEGGAVFWIRRYVMG